MRKQTPSLAEKRSAEKAKLLASLRLIRPSNFNISIAPATRDSALPKVAGGAFRTS